MSGPVSAARLPDPPRRRRAGLAALAVLLIVTAAAVAGLLALRLDSRVPVLVAARELSVGHQIERSDLATVAASADGLSLIPQSEAGAVIGQYVTQHVPTGRPLDRAMFGGPGLLKDGWAAVGIPLKAGTAPASGLHSGDVVNVVQAKDGAGVLLVADAVVGSVREARSGSFSSGSTEGAVTVVLPDRTEAGGLLTSTRVAAAASAGQIVLVLTKRDATSGGG